MLNVEFLVTLNDHPVSVVVVVVGVNFFGFSSLEPLHGFNSNFVWMFLGWTSTKFVKIGVVPLFLACRDFSPIELMRSLMRRRRRPLPICV